MAWGYYMRRRGCKEPQEGKEDKVERIRRRDCKSEAARCVQKSVEGSGGSRETACLLARRSEKMVWWKP